MRSGSEGASSWDSIKSISWAVAIAPGGTVILKGRRRYCRCCLSLGIIIVDLVCLIGIAIMVNT